LAQLLADPEALAGWIREMLGVAPRAQVEPMRQLLRELRPDVVAIDTMAYAGAIAAELEGIPWVGWATSLNPVLPDALDSELLRTLRALEPARRALFEEHGLTARFRSSDVLSPRGTATFATEALTGPAPEGVELVGPSLGGTRGGEAPPLGFGDGRPVLYVSFGSQAWHQPRRYERLLRAAAELDVAVFAAMGELAAGYREEPLPPHVRCVPFAAQLEVLPKASLVVTHGGANSVMEALAFGVPLLISPLCNDQPHNLHFVSRAGAGMGIDLERCSDAALVEALRRLIAEGPERDAARRIGQSYRSRNGHEGAAEMTLRAMG
jgi:MGT family glycosyltransferase